MSILYYLESIRTPFLDAFFSSITQLGDETLTIVFGVIIYWCVSKKWGAYTMVVSFASLYVNQIVKILTRIPRPWVAYPGFTIVESAREAAVGYSFPSGHTANVVCLLGCWARFTQRKWLRWVFIVLIALVSFSRMYLGVHYPKDVLFSLAVGIVLVLGLYPVFAPAEGVSRRLRGAFFIIAFLSVVFMVFMYTHRWPADIDAENLYSAKKNAFLMIGVSGGMVAGIYFDKKVLDFRVKAPWWGQILKVVLGILLVLLIKNALKAILPDALWWTAPRYFLIVVFATCVWPMTFPWFSRGCKRKKHEI